MKCSTVLLVTSGALLIGATAYGIYKYYQNKPQTKEAASTLNVLAVF